ncbi:hypothetical protein [Micromonospora sp. NPDC005171]|uniref:hypothetical protein n=1 Tax=Micromonospora sp. NPDC005171 TaxID=3156866 RepID=UPI0033BEAE8A
MSAVGRLLRLLATSPYRRVPGGAAPVLHNVLLTLVTDRLSGDAPLSGDERSVPAAVRCRLGSARLGPARPGPARPGPRKIVLDPGCSGVRMSEGHYVHVRA